MVVCKQPSEQPSKLSIHRTALAAATTVHSAARWSRMRNARSVDFVFAHEAIARTTQMFRWPLLFKLRPHVATTYLSAATPLFTCGACREGPSCRQTKRRGYPRARSSYEKRHTVGDPPRYFCWRDLRRADRQLVLYVCVCVHLNRSNHDTCTAFSAASYVERTSSNQCVHYQPQLDRVDNVDPRLRTSIQYQNSANINQTLLLDYFSK
jgi:hypothetical protein